MTKPFAKMTIEPFDAGDPSVEIDWAALPTVERKARLAEVLEQNAGFLRREIAVQEAA